MLSLNSEHETTHHPASDDAYTYGSYLFKPGWRSSFIIPDLVVSKPPRTSSIRIDVDSYLRVLADRRYK